MVFSMQWNTRGRKFFPIDNLLPFVQGIYIIVVLIKILKSILNSKLIQIDISKSVKEVHILSLQAILNQQVPYSNLELSFQYLNLYTNIENLENVKIKNFSGPTEQKIIKLGVNETVEWDETNPKTIKWTLQFIC